VRDCSHYLDVQRLTTEQREELIKDLMALKDAVEKEEACFAPEEDFVECGQRKVCPGRY